MRNPSKLGLQFAAVLAATALALVGRFLAILARAAWVIAFAPTRSADRVRAVSDL